MSADQSGRSPSPVRHLGTCADCYTWVGLRGSAHDPWRCPFLRDAISRLEREIEKKQARWVRLQQTLALIAPARVLSPKGPS